MPKPLRRHFPALLLTLLAGLSVVWGCGGARASSGFAQGGNPSSVELEVVNRNFADVQVWAHRAGQRLRVGFVAANQSKTFTIPWRTRDGMRVELDLSNGVWCLVDEVLVDPGEELLVEVDPNIERDPDCRRRR